MKQSSFQRDNHDLRPFEAILKECTHSNLSSNPTLEPISIKLLTKSSWVGTHSFSGQEPTVSPFAGKAIELSFSTSPKTLSLRFHSALVYREAELLVTTICLLDLSLVGYFRKALFNHAKHQLGHLGYICSQILC